MSGPILGFVRSVERLRVVDGVVERESDGVVARWVGDDGGVVAGQCVEWFPRSVVVDDTMWVDDADWPLVVHVAREAGWQVGDDVLPPAGRRLAPVGDVAERVGGFVLHPYQRAAVEVACEWREVVLADDVGLGKTIQAIACVYSAGSLPVLVVVKPSLKQVWANEIAGSAGWKCLVAEGRSPGDVDLDGVEVLVVNPQILEAWLPIVERFDPVGLIVDEAHFLANDETKQSQLIARIARNVRAKPGRMICLCTATIAPNGAPLEVAGILSFLGYVSSENPVFGVSKFEFAQRYCGAWHNGFNWVYDTKVTDPVHGDKVRAGMVRLRNELVETCMVRRTKREGVGDIDPPALMMVNCDADPFWVGRYRHARSDFETFIESYVTEWADRTGNSVHPHVDILKAGYGGEFGPLMLHSALRQLVAATKTRFVVDWVHRFLDEHEDQKLIVFAHHKAVQRILAGINDGMGDDEPKPVWWGSDRFSEARRIGTEMRERFGTATILSKTDQKPGSMETDKHRFQTDPSCRLMVCSLSSGSEGHTLTAAHHIAFAELPMTAKTYRQAIGRCYGRANDPHSVTVWDLVAGTGRNIDSDTAARLHRKGMTLDLVLDGDLFEVEEDWKAYAIETVRKGV